MTTTGPAAGAAAAPLRWLPAAAGAALLLAAVLVAPGHARAAAAQVWPAFVLVAGLLLVGLVAEEDRLFAAGGQALARLAPNGVLLYLGTVVLVLAVTTLLNLDTSVTFLTPVLVYAARSRGEGEAPLLYACLLLSNAGSLLLPGSNLTNLIVLGHLHLSGGDFLAHMALPALAAAVVTALVVGALHHRSLRTTVAPTVEPERPVLGVGLVAVIVVTILVVALRAPALPVAAVGVVAFVLRSWQGDDRRASARSALQVLGVPVLVGLFGLAVALGTLGRSWSGPATLLTHLDDWGTAAVAAASSVLVNNLPAASLLAARRPPHPYALLIGLNVGPNLFVTGSLAWVLWLRAARRAGGHPDVRRASLLGLASVPLAVAAAVGVLVLTGAG
ncbi:MAG TPA: SLC13 family permease [Acidimicrobiales bacterium]|jgi:arsenical pump membrane protein|nr:SLC13 family permease [Acidimicrobiales bacterium]